MGDSEEVSITKYLILDTNVFTRMGEDSEVGKQIVEYLEKLVTDTPGWGLAISEFTLFETMNEMPFTQEIKMSDTLATFPSYIIDRENLYIAAHIGCLYAEHYKDIKITDKLPEPGDKIIAATAIRNDTLICTSNMRDYPAPFFKEYQREIFTHSTKKGLVHTVVYIMQPQITLINEFYEKRTKESTKTKTAKKVVKKKS